MSATLGECSGLADLYLGSYGVADLTPLRWNTELSRLRLKDRPRVRTLAGLEFLPRIEHLGIYGAPLEDISAVVELAGVRELHLESCPIRDLSPIGCLNRLRLLNASDCGDVTSIDPVRSHLDLEVLWLFGTTRILDDDLGPIARLPLLRELRMKARRTYRPSVEAIQAAIEGRAPFSSQP